MNNTPENREKISHRIYHREFFSFKDLFMIFIDIQSEMEKIKVNLILFLSNIKIKDPNNNLFRFIIIDSFSEPLLPVSDMIFYQI